VAPSNPIEKAKAYAAQKFAAVANEINQKSEEILIRTRSEFAARGAISSGARAQAEGKSRAERLKMMMQARVDSLIDGFELYDVPITDALRQWIVNEVSQMHAAAVASAAHTLLPGRVGGAGVLATMVRAVPVPVASIYCQIEERRVNPKMKPKAEGVTNVYHVSGDNSRVSIDSVDKSVNVVFTSSEQLFQTMRARVQTGIPADQQAVILDRLDALEKAKNDPSFAHRYSEFIAAAANHMTLLGPFIPALTELLRRALA